MNLLFTLLVVAIAAVALLFFAKFTRYGTVDFASAWKSFTLWGAAAFAVFGQFVAELLSWLAGLWEPLQAQAGDLLANPSFGKALQLVGLFFFLLRSKSQGFPTFPKFPSPDKSD